MDNLFACIVPFKDSNKANALINNKLIGEFFKPSSSVFTEIPNENYFISLVKYSSENAISANEAKTEINELSSPLLTLIGNLRLDDGHSNNEQTLLTAYNKKGAAAFSTLKGNFHTLFWHQQSQQLCGAIDAFSSRSLFYLQIGGALYLASEAKTLAQITNSKLTINKVAVSQWLAGRPNPNLSMFNEIVRLPAGHCLEFSKKQGLRITKNWDIDANFSINYSTVEEYKDHFFELLQTSVKNRLTVPVAAKNTAIFSQMSGGMDSTSVTAIAKQLLDEKNKPLHTLSHRYQNTRSCDESSNIIDMIEMLDLKNQHYIELDGYGESSFSQLYPTDFDNPGVVLSPKYHQELALMSNLGAGVLLTGNGGDETCWGHSATYRSRLFKGEIGVISEVIAACHQLNEPVARSLYKLFMPSGIQTLIKLARQKPVDTNECPPWLSPQALSIVKDKSQLIGNPYSALFNPAKHARYHGLKTTSTYNSMRSYQKVASGYGVDVRHPFFDVDIVNFSFAVPEKLLIQGVYPKWLLRQTMQHHLPPSVCWNKHKVVFDHHFANLVRSNKAELRQVLSHEGLQELGLLDNSILLKEFDAVVNNPNGYLNVDMLYAILTQLWFQTHVV